MREKDKPKVGMVLLILGFIILLINAVDYLSGFFGVPPLMVKLPSSVFGIILAGFGMFLSKKK